MEDVSYSIEGKVVLVAGGVIGIGAGLIRYLVSHNAMYVVFLDVLEREGEVLERELLNQYGGLKAKFIKCDITDEEQLLSAYNQVLEKYRRIDAVINNVMVANNDNLEKMIDASYNTVIASTFNALEEMRADKSGSGGVILNLSSFLGLTQRNNILLELSKEVENREPFSKTKVRIITAFLGPTDTALLHISNYIENQNNLSGDIFETQRVTSAVTGVIDVITRAESGSTWIIVNDKPPFEVTDVKGFDVPDINTI
ncbi:putative alcohol dehydrogenase [Danaus plexippus plexippus]|uniref:15-hydroxyprostaglandin dehydrogenase [NAD(+)] n=1 Tax=Danaus plexippus plexippus TaxID=278856 RepID=A0A212F0F4_DANPL|nr:putative alcohol dehydrogenase [Danaus plexippus plexippus]